MRANGDLPLSNVRVVRLNDGNAEITLYRGWALVEGEDGEMRAEGDLFILTTNLRGQKIPWDAGLQARVEASLADWYALTEAIENVDPLASAWGGASGGGEDISDLLDELEGVIGNE